MLIRRLLTYSILSLVALGGFFGSVHIETANQGNNIISVSYEGNGVYAEPNGCRTPEECNATNTAANTSSTEMTKMLNSLLSGLNIILGLLTIVVSPAIMFAGWLMSPDWTSGDLFGLRTPMYSLWVTVSNIVYFVYAILLILIALGTMFGKESFSYKVMLPKLALGILMVPFTWWFVQWTISLSAVVTASVMTIPSEALSKFSTPDSWWEKASIPKTVTIDNGAPKKSNTPTTTAPTSNVTTLGVDNPGSTKCIDPVVSAGNICTSPKALLNSAGGMYSSMLIYAYSVFKFDKVTDIDTTLGAVKVALQLVNQSVMGMIMFIVFGLLTLALVSMLLVRAIKLWIYAIFSPLFTFQFVAGGAMKGVDNSDTFTIKEFVGLCFVPAIVGLTLSFGLIIISVVSSGGTQGTSTKCTESILRSSGCQIASLMGIPSNTITKTLSGETEKTIITTVKMGDFTMNFVGKIEGTNTVAREVSAANSTTGVLDSAGGIFGTLIIDIIALVFIWMAFMAAKNVSKAVKMAVEPFEKIGSQVGNLAKSIPKYTPIPGLGMSASTLGKTAELSQQKFESTMRTRDEEKVGKLFPGLVEGSIKELERIKAQEKLKGQITNYPGIQSTLGELNTGMKATQANIDANQRTITQAGVNREEFEKNIKNDRSISDEHMRSAAMKFAKNEKLDTKEIELVMKWLGSKGTAPNGGAGASGTTSLNQNGDGKISLGGININLNGTSLSKHDELATKIITGVTSKASTMNKPTLDEIKKELENMGLAEKVDEVAKKIETGIEKLPFKPKV